MILVHRDSCLCGRRPSDVLFARVKMRRLGLLRRWLIVLAAVLSVVPAACGGFEIISHSALADDAKQQILFQITFDQSPDFFSTDKEGRPRHSFQYWYDAEPGGFEFAGEDVSVIRGPEIRFVGEIPIRDSLNPSGEEFPNAEGWGKQRGLVPFQVDGFTVTFAANWTDLGETDGRFSYRLLAFEFGEQTSDVALPILVGLPSPLIGGAIALLAAARYVPWRKSMSTGTRTDRPLSDRSFTPSRSRVMLANRSKPRGIGATAMT